ncbi:uncharacterized protein LOC117342867 [Pecten maximus]|uniref:uncharacterized protein LOC117342867 n=1 Tax=Pecten maximus TaxID=6579 RepID=UPI0014580E28|nr:uncharacterized protein LOC117342867 [Pecten maximus]
MACKEIQFVLYIILARNIIVLSISRTDPEKTDQLPLHIQESSTRPVYNLTSLIYEYYLICGPQYICDKHHFSFISELDSNPTVKICPECKCDRQCVTRQDCCPDVVFSMPEEECVTTSLLHGRSNKASNHYIIADCHEKSSEDLKDKCTKDYTDIKSLYFPPVTSAKYAFTFRNKFCAECNGITNYTEWNIDISCFDFVDLNFLSSYEAIFNTAESRGCQLKYKTDRNDMRTCRGTTSQPSVKIFEPVKTWCNVTGTWTYYDKDIESACSTDDMPRYKNYRNIFCFICNPPDYLVEQEIISTCNVSGIWSPYDASIERNCDSLDWTPNTQPYKNVFCFLCNRNNTNHNHYFDVSITTVEKVDRLYTYYFSVIGYNLDFYHAVLEKSKTRMLLSKIHKPLPLFQKTWNTTKLQSYHYAVDGVGPYCQSTYTFYLMQPCSCDLKTCLFRYKPPFCCLDVLLKAPTSCFSDILVESSSVEQRYSEPYGAVNKCGQSNVDGVNDQSQLRCGIAADDIFGTLPVTHEKMIYKNFDCMWCNLNSREKQQREITPWHVEIKCQSEINANFHVMLNDVIKTAKSMDCAVRIFPRQRNSGTTTMSKMYCGNIRTSHLINKCNIANG